MSVRVRIAPSPTGLAHIGTAYTSLFNWAFAKKLHGTFILRLEDTDQKRHVPEAERVIYEALDWLKLTPDESPIHPGKFGPYRQSERLDLYQKAATKLKKLEKAYEKDGALWLSLPKTGTFGWNDKIRGQIEFEVKNLKDWVIVKSDGFPTYSFANVIDDSAMQITHVIRGEEHISNTPLQLSAYQALGFTPPEFAHLPVLRNSDHKKLSKRRDPVSLVWFKDQGYLPEAILNFLALQGWSHPQEKDIFDTDEFVRELTLERVRTSAPVFDFKKLNWLNSHYIKLMDDQQLISVIKTSFAPDIPIEIFNQALPLIKDRLRLLSEAKDSLEFFYLRPTVSTQLICDQTKRDNSELIHILEQFIYSYENLSNWSIQELDYIGHRLLNESGWSPKELFMTIRVAISGRTATPPLFDTMAVLGKAETITRLKIALKMIRKQQRR